MMRHGPVLLLFEPDLQALCDLRVIKKTDGFYIVVSDKRTYGGRARFSVLRGLFIDAYLAGWKKSGKCPGRRKVPGREQEKQYRLDLPSFHKTPILLR